MQAVWVFQGFLEENVKNRILTLLLSKCMIAKITTKDFKIMLVNNSKQLNKHKYLNRSNGLLPDLSNYALQRTDIIELCLEGP